MDNVGGYFFDDPIDFMQPPPIVKWETKCPHCRQNIFFIDESKAPNYDKDMLAERMKQLKSANELFFKMDEWAMENVGTTYMASTLKAIYEKWKCKEGE